MVSAKEFRNWLFPHNINAAMNTGEASARENKEAMLIFLDVLQTVFKDDPVAFFEAMDMLVYFLSIVSIIL